MSNEFKVAIVRALYTALVVAGLSFFTTLGAGADAGTAAIAAGASAFGILAARAGVEGYVDTQRNRRT